MVKVVALNTVHLCREAGERSETGKVIKPAKVDIMKPGKIFDIDDDQYEELLVTLAIRKATKADVAAADGDGHLPADDDGPSETLLEKSKKSAG